MQKNKYDKAAAAKARNEKVAETLEMLKEGLQSIRSSAEYKNYLKVMSKFPSYSMKNTLLIFKQCPYASYVAGFRTWQKEFDRHVRKGEKGIRILAPRMVDKENEKDPSINNEQIKDKSVKKSMIGFHTIYVFDISQTEGKPLPTPVQTEILSDEVERFDLLFKKMCSLTPFKVVFEDLKSGTNGVTRYLTSTIALQKDMPQLQTVKTLLHEITHSRLHNPDLCPDEELYRLSDQSIKETEAESTAYVVASYFGLDTSGFSFPYLVLWSEQEDELLENSLDRISKTSAALIEELEQKLKKIHHPILARQGLNQALNPVQ